jgi:hypothetical protein
MRTFLKAMIIAASLIISPVNAGKGLTELQVFLVYKQAVTNFTYVHDFGDTWDVFDIAVPFMGDCEDFAFSLQKALGFGQVYVVSHNGVADHAVFVLGGYVWEMNGEVITIQAYLDTGNILLFGLGPISIADKKQ